MKSVHLLIPDLFLPEDFAADACAGLSLPAMERLLGRGRSELLAPVSLEQLLCLFFGVPCADDVPIAPISAAFDGLEAGCWLRADPVNLSLQRDRLLLSGVRVSSEEAAALCVSLNGHFAGQGIEFHAPHPQRWYLRLDALPLIRTTPLSEVLGRDVRGALPAGDEAVRWHQLSNEIQMLLHAHPLNDSRESRGEPAINSLWFWGGGCDTLLAKPADCGNSRQAAQVVSEEVDAASCDGGGCDGAYAPLHSRFDCVSSDDVLAEMFARAAGVRYLRWEPSWQSGYCDGKQLLVWGGLRAALQRGDLATWRTALQQFETGYAQPLLQALRSGRIANLQLDIVGSDSLRRTRVTRGDLWAFWRPARGLAGYSMV